MSACLDDGNVVISARQGEATSAFADFVRRCRPGLLRAVRRRLASDEDAEDITQEALLRTWRRREEHADDTHRRNFAHMVAQQLVIDLYRRKDHQVEVRADFADDLLGSAPCPSELYVSAEERANVGAALRALPEDQRSLLIDCDVHGLSLDELRTRYDTTAEVLRYRRFRARKALRRQMERAGAPAFVPLFLLRLPGAIRNALRWMQEAAATGVVTQTAIVFIATISVVVSPLGEALVRTRPAIAAPTGVAIAWSDPAHAVKPHTMSGPRPAVSATSVARRSPAAATTDRSSGPLAVARLPRVCVDDACGPGGATIDNIDVITVHVPVYGDTAFREDVAPACRYVPDQPVATCETQGDPEYVVNPPIP